MNLDLETFKKRRLFLSSNSVYKDMKYLEHSVEEMLDFLNDVSRILFIPFAAVAEKENLDKVWTDYAEAPRKAFAPHNVEVVSIHTVKQASEKQQAIRDAKAVFIGGGNTHHLLFYLKKFDLIEVIQERMNAGVPMMGSSAGTNVFCPTICTTNDMPIIANSDFDAIGGVHFQINPHYLDSDPNSDHRGETREQRINEFLRLTGKTVLGLREGAWLRIKKGEILLQGLSDARLFKADQEPLEIPIEENGRNINEFLF